MCEYEFVHVSVGAHGGQRRVLNPLKLELQVVVSHLTQVLGTKLQFSSLQGQYLFLMAEPSLQALRYNPGWLQIHDSLAFAFSSYPSVCHQCFHTKKKKKKKRIKKK